MTYANNEINNKCIFRQALLDPINGEWYAMRSAYICKIKPNFRFKN